MPFLRPFFFPFVLPFYYADDSNAASLLTTVCELVVLISKQEAARDLYDISTRCIYDMSCRKSSNDK